MSVDTAWPVIMEPSTILHAFDQLFCQQMPILVAIAQGITQCRCLAEDVVQDVFIKCREYSLTEAIRQPEHYLKRMVRNQAIDRLRHRSMVWRHCGADFEDSLNVACASQCPESHLLREECLGRISQNLQQLPQRTRTAFELHRLQGLTQKEVAQQLQVSTTLVNFMVRDAHQACTQVLTSD